MPTDRMPIDERLKKRVSVPRTNKDYAYLPENRIHRLNTSEYGQTSTPQTLTSATSKMRLRKRSKGSMPASHKSVASIKRTGRVFALQNGIEIRSVVSIILKMTTFLVCLATVFFISFENDGDKGNTRNLRKNLSRLQRTKPEFELFFSTKAHMNFSQTYSHIDAIEEGFERHQDYGGLEIRDVGQRRQISDSGYLLESDFRLPEKSRDDDGNDAYLAFDDDYLRGTEGTLNANPSGKICHRTSAHRVNFQNCNSIFEIELLSNSVKYLNAGAYRQVFSLQHSLPQQYESIVIKDMHADNEFASGDYEFVRMDAMVAERLTSSPRIYDIYGFCGLSILSEFFAHGDIEKEAVTGSGYLLTEEEQQRQQLSDLKSYNDMSSGRKIAMSLEMAEAVADLHGDTFGVIVHQDIQLSQFLMSSDNTVLKLNDFNRAEFMLWDEKEKEYCRYGEGSGHGNWRSPEEYFDYDLNEQVDVFSLGNNMYSLLTGLWIFYDEDDNNKIQERVKAGEKPHIDPRYEERSPAEAKLVEIIDWCHSYHPEDRPSIFQVVSYLRDALKEVSA